MRRATAAVIGLALAAPSWAPASAQDAGSAGPKPSAEPVLGGPRVEEPPARATIVERGFDGSMRAIDGPPEFAALARLELDGPTRAAVRAALDERASVIDGILADHFSLFLEVRGALQAARSGGQRGLGGDARETLGEFRGAIAPLTTRGTLREEIARLLPPDARGEFESMMREHDEAAAAQREGPTGERPRGGERARGRAGALRSYLAEFRDSYERVVGQRQEDFEATLKKLALTPEQEAKLRDATRRALAENGPGATPEQRRAAIEAFLRELPAGERREVIAKLRALRAGP